MNAMDEVATSLGGNIGASKTGSPQLCVPFQRGLWSWSIELCNTIKKRRKESGQ